MISKINKFVAKGIALLLNASFILSLLSLYTFSADGNSEEYSKPWLWPVPGSYQINSLDTYTDGSIHNQGQAIDIGSNGYKGSERLDVISSTDGTVHYIQSSHNETTNKGSGWGNYVVVKTADFYVVYAHLKTVNCSYGEIKAGDLIGKMGTTGNSTGVHLHVQAYPIGKSSSSTDIHVFDNFINNPLYAPNFKFWAGLHTYSARYGSVIRQYYTNVSGTYYTYSGGRELSYAPQSLSAQVTSIRIAGANVYSAPTSSSSIVSTIPNGECARVYGYYIDSYGKIWFLLSEDSESKWVCETDVGFNDYVFDAKYVNKSAPSGAYGSFFDIYFDGTIASSNIITDVRAQIRREDDVIAECTISVNSNKYEINNSFSDGLHINTMANGEYIYELFVTESASFPGADSKSSTYSLYSSEFTINSQLSDTVPPLVEQIKIESLSTDNIKISAVATDNHNISRVTFTFESIGGSFTKTFEASNNDSLYFADVGIDELNGSGQYRITALATDNYGNTDSSVTIVNIPKKEAGELWIVTDADPSLRVRTGPGTSYSKAGNLYNGDKITVTEVVSANGYLWGHFEGGWCALNYCTYESGYMFSVTFNLNGGNADIESVIGKKYGGSITIPNVEPTRNGFTFKGWATAPSTEIVTYSSGDVYTADTSVILFAVWIDSNPPSISDISLSTNEWTSQGVSVSVTATDDSGVIYYSFDGGKSWRMSNTIYVTENTVFNANDIAVKDMYGNIVYYLESLTISNIDNEAPIPADSDIAVSVNGKSATFTFEAATDILSGIQKYELVYSLNSDFANSTTSTITSGDMITLEDGVYYAKLIIYDNVGNSTSVNIKRFLVGQATKLAVTSGLKVSSSSSELTLLTWDHVTNCDKYEIILSTNADLSSPSVFTSEVNNISLSDLSSGNIYYVAVVALCTDGVYLNSDRSQSISFETVSSDNTIHSFVDYEDAIISDNIVSITLKYAATTFNMAVTINDKSSVKYYNDVALTDEITALTEAFAGISRTVYIKVTSENGDTRVYTVNALRAGKNAQTPNIIYNAVSESYYVNDTFTSTIAASVTDGGIVSIVWYASIDGNAAFEIGNGSTVSFKPAKAGEYKVYAVVTNTNNKCEAVTASSTSAKSTLIVNRRATEITVIISDKVYDGTTVAPTYSDYNGDGDVSFIFYNDIECNNEISTPINAGVYYVVAIASQTDEYMSSGSAAVRFEITKASCTISPQFTVTQPTLRDRNGYILFNCDGIEYSVNNGIWQSVSNGASVAFNEEDVVSIRIAEGTNYFSSNNTVVSIEKFVGTDSFISNGRLDITLTDTHMLINSNMLSVNDVLSGLEKTDNVYITDNSGNNISSYVHTSCIIMIKDSVGVYKQLTIIIVGDVDSDGVVTSKDSTLILEYSNGVKSVPSDDIKLAADLDGDGTITSIDSYKAHIKSNK